MMLDLNNSFLAAITATGMSTPQSIIPDGQIHRFYNGKRGSKTGWYVFNGYAGAFGDWRTGAKHRFHPSDDRTIKFDLDKISKRAAQLTAQREKEIKAQHAKAKITAQEIWKNANEVSVHPYLINKAVQSFGLREHNTGELILPGYNVLDELTTLQFISATGNKLFLPKGQVNGSYFTIGSVKNILCIAEGYATAATIHQCTGYPVAVAFNASNLCKTTTILRLKHTSTKIIICADDDFETEGNPGLTKAKEAAIENRSYLAIPNFCGTRTSKATDFNDMALAHGSEAVKGVIDNAKQR